MHAAAAAACCRAIPPRVPVSIEPPLRAAAINRRHATQVPYLEDPDNGVALFESAAILEYLEKTYGSGGGAAAST